MNCSVLWSQYIHPTCQKIPPILHAVAIQKTLQYLYHHGDLKSYTAKFNASIQMQKEGCLLQKKTNYILIITDPTRL
jgi:hypothetical protein